jgi:hypothetical protein
MKRIVLVHKEFHGNFIIHRETFHYYYFIALSSRCTDPGYYSLYRLHKKDKTLFVYKIRLWRYLPYTLSDKYYIEK